jgi:hypothetical protein
MGEIEAHLSEMGISFQRVSETSIQVVRQVGPQTVHVTIDTARTLHLVSAEGVKDLTLGDSASTRLYFDPEWKERYDFDLALEDKTFALLNAASKEPDDLPAPPVPAPPLGMQRAPSSPATVPSQKPAAIAASMMEAPAPPLGMQRKPSSPTVPSQKPAVIAASMMEALRSVPGQEEEAPQSLAEISAMIPKRAGPPPVSADLSGAPTQNEPILRPARARDDDAPLPVPAVILPSTPDGKPPVLSPATEGSAPPPLIWRSSTPIPPPVGAEPPRPSGRVHIANGTTRDVIDVPISARAEQAPEAAPGGVQGSPEELPPLESPSDDAPDPSVIVTEPDMAAYRSSGEHRAPAAPETVTRPTAPPPPLHRAGEPAVTDDTTRSPVAPRAVAARARRSGLAWAGLLGLAIGAAGGLQFAVPGRLAGLFPPTAASEVRAGAQSARQGDVDGALAHFHRAAELDPKWAPAWRNLGVAYALKGDQVQSVEAYRKYLELEQDPEQARQVRTLLEK